MKDMLSSKDLMERAGLSRATLNNYVAQGLLPRPQVRRPTGTEDATAPRLGYFPAEALDVISKIHALKDEGRSMAEIAVLLKADPTRAATTKSPFPTVTISLDQVTCPAYLVNSRFEVEWANDAARDLLFGGAANLSRDITERNLFTLLYGEGAVGEAMGADADPLIKFHLGIAKGRISKGALMALDFENIGDRALDTLVRLYDEAETIERGPVQHLPLDLGGAERANPYDLYASFFREGIFFAYAPAEEDADTLLQLLARRDIVIRDLLKKRDPHLTPLGVLVADIQNSVQICAELPPEEYFELINDVWSAMEPKLRQYYATHGKHVGDGMVYYFFPQPDCNYIENAIRCAWEMKAEMAEISRRWQKRKNWVNDLKLNIGLAEGREWFGAYQTPTHLEFSALGDTINMAGRLSDFARDGTVWITKNMLGQLTASERQHLHYGIRRRAEDGAEMLASETFARISNLVDLDRAEYGKFRDIAVLPVTEILDVASRVRSE